MTPATGQQTYKAGWAFACIALASAADPTLAPWWGVHLRMLLAVWGAVLGFAAAAVKPWSWYVLLAFPCCGNRAGRSMVKVRSERMEEHSTHGSGLRDAHAPLVRLFLQASSDVRCRMAVAAIGALVPQTDRA